MNNRCYNELGSLSLADVDSLGLGLTHAETLDFDTRINQVRDFIRAASLEEAFIVIGIEDRELSVFYSLDGVEEAFERGYLGSPMFHMTFRITADGTVRVNGKDGIVTMIKQPETEVNGIHK